MLGSRNRSVALIGLLLLSTGTHVAEIEAAEVDAGKAAGVMAAYLRHIAALTHWPGDESTEEQPIRIGVVGRDPNGVMAPIRERTESGDGLLAQGRPIRVLDLEQASDDAADLDRLASCALLFFSHGADEQWQRIQAEIGALPIVTVSEMEGFADRGGMIEYFIEPRSGKVRMKVNLQAMRAAGISFSARFLALKAVIVLREREEA
jgi:hypothetical protein